MTRVGVLMGGPSSEHDISLLSGASVLRALRLKKSIADGFVGVPIFITQSGLWLVGEERALETPHAALSKIDVAFNALHGEYGEDGGVQRVLDRAHIPFTGSEALASAISMNKEMARGILIKAGIRMPASLVLGPSNIDTRSVLALSAPPWIVKPRSRGSSLGVSKVRTQAELPDAFRKALQFDTHMIVEEFIPGREITCGILEGMRGAPASALVPVEIMPREGSDFFDYASKYNGKREDVCPAEFYGAMLARIQDTALQVHNALGLRHYSRVDMILKPSSATRRAPEIYVLEANALPGLMPDSLFAKAARHAGLEFPDLIHHLIRLA